MSISAMAMVWESDLPATDRLVLLSIADHADERGKCYPSIGRLVSRTGLTDRAIQKAVKRLCEAGYLSVEAGGGRSNTNLFRVSKPRTTFTPNDVHPEPRSPETPNVVRVNPEPRSPEPSLTIKEPSERRAREALCRVLSEKVADAYIAHRKAKLAKLTDHAAELIAQKLEGHPDPDSVALESIANGWTGVFPKPIIGGTNDKPASKSQARVSAFIAGARGTS